jgi:hypothetical protein
MKAGPLHCPPLRGQWVDRLTDFGSHRRRGEESMTGKARLILALLMSSVMVCMVTLIVTWLNLGLRPDFLVQWLIAYCIAWPIAAGTAFAIMPAARRITERIVALIDGPR